MADTLAEEAAVDVWNSLEGRFGKVVWSTEILEGLLYKYVAGHFRMRLNFDGFLEMQPNVTLRLPLRGKRIENIIVTRWIV
jgi:hypothetical protein